MEYKWVASGLARQHQVANELAQDRIIRNEAVLADRQDGAQQGVDTAEARKIMKRSEINTIIRNADAFIRSHGFRLPPFAYWTPADWLNKGVEVSGIVERQLGWYITDFGQGNFSKIGLFLFTTGMARWPN